MKIKLDDEKLTIKISHAELLWTMRNCMDDFDYGDKEIKISDTKAFIAALVRELKEEGPGGANTVHQMLATAMYDTYCNIPMARGGLR